ncbi:MAG: DUF4824 family protein, partial [Gammaproteobacteria bacterium]|nr:DUF4824 family protein [Gammaproteobacteria bacterium]NIR31784.1 DUF4824 family protein [Gammaproteobacteria bacterium]NIR98715.1 DUF4824 family protein [Gammaproteobacteria bacterium]NIT64432.1 DUF4824 family protein [Gammaproteobacteria bacterium]NIV20847.1 DUF4824 family protein [Gammaproteobacteria bacterium]
MRRMGLAGAFALVVLVNGAVLAGVAWNRSGTPDATLPLTERELRVHYNTFRNRENSGVALSLITTRTTRSPQWLGEAKLRQLGFEPQRLRDGGSEYRKSPLPRRAFVVLEHDGPAWAALLKAKEREVAQLPARIEAGERTERHLEQARQALERMRESASRLVPVDVGIDPEALRNQYSDRRRYAVMAAEIRMGYGGRGSIGRILSGPIHVPVR